MRKELEGLPPIQSAASCVNFGERLSFLDMMQSLALKHDKDVDALHELLRDISGDEGLPRDHMTALRKMTKTTPIRWDEVMRTANVWFDRLVGAMRLTVYKEREAELKKVYADLRESEIPWKELPKTAKTFPVGIENPGRWLSEQVGSGMAAMLLPAVEASTRAETRAVSHINATRLAFALAAHRLDQGGYPRKLNELAPRYIEVVPKDPIGNDIKFATDAKGYTLTVADPAKIYDVVVCTPDRKNDQPK